MSRKLDVSALAAKAESGNNSSVRRIEALEIAISDLVLEEPFKSLFAIREEIKNAIRSHMQEHGYDESKPVDVWKRSGPDGFDYVLVDGFTRTQAAKEAGTVDCDRLPPCFCQRRGSSGLRHSYAERSKESERRGDHVGPEPDRQEGDRLQDQLPVSARWR